MFHFTFLDFKGPINKKINKIKYKNKINKSIKQQFFNQKIIKNLNLNMLKIKKIISPLSLPRKSKAEEFYFNQV